MHLLSTYISSCGRDKLITAVILLLGFNILLFLALNVTEKTLARLPCTQESEVE